MKKILIIIPFLLNTINKLSYSQGLVEQNKFYPEESVRDFGIVSLFVFVTMSSLEKTYNHLVINLYQ